MRLVDDGKFDILPLRSDLIAYAIKRYVNEGERLSVEYGAARQEAETGLEFMLSRRPTILELAKSMVGLYSTIAEKHDIGRLTTVKKLQERLRDLVG